MNFHVMYIRPRWETYCYLGTWKRNGSSKRNGLVQMHIIMDCVPKMET